MKCALCNSKDYKKRPGTVRDNKDLEIYECSNCGLVFLSDNDHIDNTFYENSNMHTSFDFQKWRNETEQDDKRRFEFVQSIITNKNILDFGSGNGGFLKKAKNNCKDIAGVELENAISSHYEKDQLKLYKNLDDIKNKKWGNFIDSEELNQAYENQLATLQATDTIIACLTKEN